MKNNILPILLLLFIGCKKGNNSDSPPDPISSTNDIVLVTTVAVPGEVVTAQANFRPSKDTATILVGEKQVLAVVIESNKIIFFMPELPAGSNALVKFQNLGANRQGNISVGVYTAITQPDVILNTFIQEQNKIVLHLEEYKNDSRIQLNPAYLDALQYVNQNIETKYATLTADEKKQIAYVMRSNMPNETEFKMEPLNPLFYARAEALTQDAEDVAWNKSGRILSEIATGLGLMAQGIAFVAAGTLVSPIPVFGMLVGISAAVAGASLFVKGLDLFVHGLGESSALNNSVVKVDQGINAGANLTFLKDIDQSVTFKGTFRKVIESDGTSSNALLKKIFSAFQSIKDGYSKMIAGFERIKIFFLGNPPVIPPNNFVINTQGFSKQIPMQGEKLTINNISNSAINLSVVKEDAALKIKATSTTVTQETNFNFDVTYNNPTTGSTVTQNINCLYKPEIDSTELYKTALLGRYIRYPDDYQGSTLFCDLLPGGAVKYSTLNYPSWPNGTIFNASWTVTKYNGKYYYSESGFYNGYPNIAVPHPLTYSSPISTFNYHELTAGQTIYVRQ